MSSTDLKRLSLMLFALIINIVLKLKIAAMTSNFLSLSGYLRLWAKSSNY